MTFIGNVITIYMHRLKDNKCTFTGYIYIYTLWLYCGSQKRKTMIQSFSAEIIIIIANISLFQFAIIIRKTIPTQYSMLS